MERFVRFVVAGGLALVAGLWLVALTPTRGLPWLAGGALALAGACGLLAGIGTEIESQYVDLLN